MIENILYRFYFFELKQELHFIANYRKPKNIGEFPIIKVWVWNYGQGKAWVNTLKDDTKYKYPNREDILEGDKLRQYLRPIYPEFFEMLFNAESYN